jgi:hypothetical protein
MATFKQSKGTGGTLKYESLLIFGLILISGCAQPQVEPIEDPPVPDEEVPAPALGESTENETANAQIFKRDGKTTTTWTDSERLQFQISGNQMEAPAEVSETVFEAPEEAYLVGASVTVVGSVLPWTICFRPENETLDPDLHCKNESNGMMFTYMHEEVIVGAYVREYFAPTNTPVSAAAGVSFDWQVEMYYTCVSNDPNTLNCLN